MKWKKKTQRAIFHSPRKFKSCTLVLYCNIKIWMSEARKGGQILKSMYAFVKNEFGQKHLSNFNKTLVIIFMDYRLKCVQM